MYSSVDSEIPETQAESPKVARFSGRRFGAALVAGLLVLVGLATAWNLEGFPSRVDDDEGTYVAQAWAILYEHTLTHYPYWYDHPPGGWIQIAIFAWVTDGFNRVSDAIFVGRQFMWCVTLLGCVLVYLLCRRLGFRRTTSAVAVLLFGLSPIAQYYHRMVSLDNVETLWVLAALVAAASPKRGWKTACRAGAWAGIAVLSKETAIILLPVIAWVLWQHDGGVLGQEALGKTKPEASAPPEPREAKVEAVTADGAEAPVWMPDWSSFGSELKRLRSRSRGRDAEAPARAASRPVTRRESFWVFVAAAGVIVLLYPLYAISRGQLPMLWSALEFQFGKRPGSGSLLNTGSYTYSLVHTWVTTDPWLLIGGLFAALFMLLSRRLRPFAVGLLLQVVILIHGGYLPYFYVTAIIPFAAVVIAGTADTLWASIDVSWLGARAAQGAGRWAAYAGRALVVVMALVAVVHVAPEWYSYLSTNSTVDGDGPYLAAASWAEHNVPKNDVVVVDDYLWVDLRTHGLKPLWIWKITPQTAPSYQTIQYIILQPQSPATLAGMPALQGAYAHSVLVKSFGGGLTVRRVVDGG